MKDSLLAFELAGERDIVVARQRARHVSELVGLEGQDQVRVATAVSELARNAVRYAGGGRIEFLLHHEAGAGAALCIAISDRGPGIADFDRAVSGVTASGEPKLGLVTAQRLMDRFQIESGARGTTITLTKNVSTRAGIFTRTRVASIAAALSAQATTDPAQEIQTQNRELLRSLEELRVRQEELTRLNAELESTNRGVLALYSELDERAAHLRMADEAKTRFLSSVSHELRTPVNSILALARILLHRLDGDLTQEQEKQVRYICQAADQLATLIDDLLDLRKVEAGKIELRVEPCTVADLFAALRGMFKPLMTNEKVALLFEEPAALPQLVTDQGKVSQILRNLISNALKFTERGSVRVSCRLLNDQHTILFEVADTGIGIAPEHHRRIFEEFTQIENPLQTKVKGTGLGLPLSQRLAGLLGGSIEVRSQLGQGSVFSVLIPMRLEQETGIRAVMAAGSAFRDAGERALIIDDNEIERYALRQFLATSRYDVIEAGGGYDGLRLARQCRPDLIFLDLVMPDVHGFEVLKMLKASDETRRIPVVIFTSQRFADEEREKIVQASGLLLKNDLSRESVADILRHIRTSTELNHAATSA